MTDLGPLTIPIAAVRRELSQIRSWIRPRHEHPFGDAESVQKFGGQLRGLVNNADQELREIENDLARDQTRSAWERYARLQREDLPQLANELLAVIGGRYLSTRNLDDMHPRDRDEQQAEARVISFSGVARDLLNDLSNRTNAGVGSLLIVGEERQVPIGTGIVRLRFPACDVWNLPFTAHEYGYLVARSEASRSFKTFREQVERGVDPRTHKPGEDAVADHPYLQDVVQFWTTGRAQLPDDPDDEPPILRELRARQTAHLCRLFGDAFATYFVGPAYVKALLQLRFRPDEQLTKPGGMVPAFVERFVVAMETLRRMDEDEPLYREIKFGLTTPFAEVLDPSTGLPSIWSDFVKSAGVRPDPYEAVKARMKPWIERIWEAVIDPNWRDEDGWPAVYGCWRDALQLVEWLKQVKPLPAPAQLARPWAVVNAADRKSVV